MRDYDTDNPSDVAELLNMKAQPAVEEAKPRRSVYGSIEALQYGLMPVEAYPDALVPMDSFKEVIEHCHQEKIFPMYHARATWLPEGTASDQDGLGYCWTWSGTSWFMTIRAVEDKPTVVCSPVAQGKWVGFNNEGWYLDGFIAKARSEGICPLPPGTDFNSTNLSASFWKQYDDQRQFYRLGGVWDCNNRAGADVMLQHSLTCLACGLPLYIAYDFWGHALVCMGFIWDTSAYKNMKPVILNSHGETDWITVSGSKSIFSEAYGGGSTVPVEYKESRYVRSSSGRLFVPSGGVC